VLAALTVFGTAEAHVPTVNDTCVDLDVDLSNYETAPGAALNNRVTVTIDGAAQVFDFDSDFTQSFAWSQTANHTWTVVVDANRVVGNASEFDTSFQGTQTACQTTTTPATTTPSTTTTTTTVPPCVDCSPVTQVTVPDPTTTVVATTSPPSSSPSSSSSPASSTSPVTTEPTCVVGNAANPNSLQPCALPPTGSSGAPLLLIALAMIGTGGVMLIARRRNA
jgi:LPXTG-motif cell wall-anchored protein